jgi:signal transduction histidine kinase
LAFRREVPIKSYSVNRVNQLFASIFSFLLVAVVSEALVNGFRQAEYLNPTAFALSVIVLLALVIGFLISHFVFGSPLVFFRSIPIFTLLLLVTWPLHYDPTVILPDSFKPWIWWLLGVAAIAAGTSFKFWLGVLYITTVALGWVALRITPSGGSGELILAIQDSVHLFVLASIGTTMAIALRWQAAKTDFASQNLIASGVKSAQSQALGIEQARLDALVHDKVLTTLLIASKAQTTAEIELARKSSKDAIQQLEAAASLVEEHNALTQVSFFEALATRIREIHPEFEVSLEQTNDSPLKESVSEALTEATLQAIDNSMKHAGSASKRKVSLQGSGKGLKIVVSDNGRGFRPSKISKDRLGIQLSIIGRVKDVGGRVFIRSAPGEGTDLVLEWSPSV